MPNSYQNTDKLFPELEINDERNSSKQKTKKKKSKYSWSEFREGKYPELNKHSLVKHELISDYVTWYIETLMYKQIIPEMSFTFVDAFAGGGKYMSDENLLIQTGCSFHYGSPISILYAVEAARVSINQDREKTRRVYAEYIFLDKDPYAIDSLIYELGEFKKNANIQHEDNMIHTPTVREYKDFFDKSLIPTLERFPKKRILLFLDQYAYKDVDYSDLAKIFTKYDNVEVIVNFNFTTLVNYLSDTKGNRTALKNIGLLNHIPIEHITEIMKSDKRHGYRSVQSLLGNAIKIQSQAKFATLFYISPEQKNNEKVLSYWLVHLSNQFRAHDNMKHLHYKYANFCFHDLNPGIFNLGYDVNLDNDYVSSKRFDFSQDSKQESISNIVDFLAREIHSQGYKGVETISELTNRLTSRSTGTESDTHQAISKLTEDKNFIVCNKNGTIRKNSVKKLNPDDFLMLNPNRPINFVP